MICFLVDLLHSKSIFRFSDPISDRSETMEDQTQITGHDETDILILSKLNDVDLVSACQTTHYINKLCEMNILWILKVQLRFPGADEFKDNREDWKKYYIKLIKTPSVHEAIKRNQSSILKWRCQYYGTLMEQQDLDYAAGMNNLEMLQWMVNIHDLDPNQQTIDGAIVNGAIGVVIWITQEYEITPSQNSINMAARYPGIEFILKNTSDRESKSLEIKSRYLDILKLMEKQFGIHPDMEGVRRACSRGWLEVLQWMYEELQANQTMKRSQ